MRKNAKFYIVALALLVSTQVNAQTIEPIKVLVAISPGATNIVALGMITQANSMMQASNLSNRQFVNANTATYVATAPCPGTDSGILLTCAKLSLETLRPNTMRM